MDTKEKIKKATAKEQIQIEVLGCHSTENLEIDKNKLRTNLESIGATVTEVGDSLMVTLDRQTFEVNTKGNVTKASEAYLARSEIEVGDYITYIPPKDSNNEEKIYHLPNSVSGNDLTETEQILGQEYNLWRVLDKKANGELEIIPAFKDTGVTYTSIYFKGAVGWNNAPYLLDDMCRTLYEKTNAIKNKSITARSIDYEDIHKLLIDGSEGEENVDNDGTGKGKIIEFQKTQIKSLSEGTYIDYKDANNATVTYKTNTYYPVLWPDVRNSLSSRYYKESTYDETTAAANGKIGTNPSTLTVKDTSYIGKINSSDFINSTKYSEIFSGNVSSWFWLATRCAGCTKVRVCFNIFFVYSDVLSCRTMAFSDGNDYYCYGHKMCPIVTLGSEVKVTPADITNTPKGENNPHIVVIQ